MAIVGGGCAGLAAAWHLSKSRKFEVSVFEKSWRLGGKCASGRTEDGRILEHGLHVWLGFYENAFRMIRECYQEVGRNDWGPHREEKESRLAHASFEDAFVAEPHIGVTGRQGERDVVWSGFLPPEKGLPGDPIDADTNPFTLASYLQRCVHLLKTLMLSIIGAPEDDIPGRPRPDARSALDETLDLDFSLDPTTSPELLIQSIAGRLRDGTLTLAAATLQAVTIFESILQDLNHSPQVVGSALNLLKALASQARKQLRDFVAIDPKLRWKTEIIDIVMTIAVGLYRDRALFGNTGLDALNDFDYRDWLRKHGATKTSLESRFITGIYDLTFAYEGGDRRRPKLAAGVALRGALRMFFTYRGAMFWRMRSGMGDAVFAPMYKVMTAGRHDRTGNPVKFHFLHELSEATFDLTDKQRRFVTALTFRPPVLGDEELGGAKARRMEHVLDALDQSGCWPDSARSMLADARRGSSEPWTLKVDEDFDVVIFAMGFDAFAELVNGTKAKGIDEASAPPAWRAAVSWPRQTVATKAAQVWLGNDLEELGWYRGSGIISALGLTFDTWADMTHALPAERAWRDAAKNRKSESYHDTRDDTARSLAYFCGVLPDRPARSDEEHRAALQQDLDELLKGMSRIWTATVAEKRRVTTKILDTHMQANVTGSDRYAQSLPGTIRHRLSPLDRSVLNMTVAGDWTACGLDAGCVEAAVMSGMLAAHAVTGRKPELDSIIGYDHP